MRDAQVFLQFLPYDNRLPPVRTASTLCGNKAEARAGAGRWEDPPLNRSLGSITITIIIIHSMTLTRSPVHRRTSCGPVVLSHMYTRLRYGAFGFRRSCVNDDPAPVRSLWPAAALRGVLSVGLVPDARSAASRATRSLPELCLPSVADCRTAQAPGHPAAQLTSSASMLLICRRERQWSRQPTLPARTMLACSPW